MQAKRIAVNEQNLGAGGQVEAGLLTPVDPREEVNFHNIWIGASAEPQNAGANAQGTWVLYLRRENAGSVTFTDAVINTETHNPIIIACGVWSTSNESAWSLVPTQMKTSRTLSPGDQLTMSCIATGVTAGLVSLRVMICAHTTRK